MNYNFNDVINMENFWGQRFGALLVDIIILTLFMYIISAIIFLLFAQVGIFLCTKLLDFYCCNNYNSIFHIYGGKNQIQLWVKNYLN